jgi:hypothetical protein
MVPVKRARVVRLVAGKRNDYSHKPSSSPGWTNFVFLANLPKTRYCEKSKRAFFYNFYIFSDCCKIPENYLIKLPGSSKVLHIQNDFIQTTIIAASFPCLFCVQKPNLCIPQSLIIPGFL